MLHIQIAKHAVNVNEIIAGITIKSDKTKTRSLNWFLSTAFTEGDVKLTILSENVYNGDVASHYARFDGIVSIKSNNSLLEDLELKVNNDGCASVNLTRGLMHNITDSFIAADEFEVSAEIVCTYISDLSRAPLPPTEIVRRTSLSCEEITKLGYVKDFQSNNYVHMALLAIYYPCIAERVVYQDGKCPTLPAPFDCSAPLVLGEGDLYDSPTEETFLSGEGLIGLDWILTHRSYCLPEQSFEHSVDIIELMKYGYAFTQQCYGKEWVFELKTDQKQMTGGYFRFSSFPSPYKTHELFNLELCLKADNNIIFKQEFFCGPLSYTNYNNMDKFDLTFVKHFTVSARIKCLDRGHVSSQRINFSCIHLKLQDVSFLVEGEVVYAHKAFLAFHSNFFKVLFEKEDSTKAIILSDLSYTAFHNALTILYRGEFVINEHNVIPLVKIAHRLNFGFVMDACEHFLRSSHNLDRMDLLVLASNYGLEQLAYEVCDFLCRKYLLEDIKNASGYKMLDIAMQKFIQHRFQL